MKSCKLEHAGLRTRCFDSLEKRDQRFDKKRNMSKIQCPKNLSNTSQATVLAEHQAAVETHHAAQAALSFPPADMPWDARTNIKADLSQRSNGKRLRHQRRCRKSTTSLTPARHS